MNGEWMITFEIAATLFAGLGLFFVGIRLISEHLRQLADQRLRALVGRATGSNRAAAFLGLVGGAITQSIHAVIFVLISLVTAGVLDARRAQPVINYANLGTSLLVLIAALDLTLMVFILVGVTGLLFYFDRDQSARLRHLIRAMLGIGLLFLGLMFIKEGAKPLSELTWMTGLMSLSAQSLLIAFATGLVFAVIAHSASSITIVTMALAASGVIDLEYGLMVVYGASFGTGVSTLILAASHKGLGRQLALYQFILKGLGLILLLPLFWIEFYGGVPLIASGLEALAIGISLQIALAYILYQVVCDLAMHPVHGPVARFLERTAPPTEEEALGKPNFIYAGAQNDAGSALVLVEKEQLRLLKRLPDYLESVRDDSDGAHHERLALHRGNLQVTEAIEQFLDEILSGALSGATLDHAIVLKNRNQLLLQLEDTLNDLATEIERSLNADASAEARALTHNLVETLHMMLLTLTDAARSGDADDIALLQSLTHDRSELMDSIRRRLLASSDLDGSVREAVFGATSLFERGIWILRRYALLLTPPEGASYEADPATAPTKS
ncbi:Na/Pi symporter [Thioalkalivibrio sp. ALJ2]|uniref:Na/Pi symporter n=1 Tax=Thioalkalivibrio sp. ALJ2 TaxID=1261622 RepID=UPI0003696424|nr:Na/Pi symporter [Thioalkalivibrio sp. ALJ2]